MANVLQFIQYILLTPTYINVLNIYAFCNTHDITWGTKGDDKAEKLPSANVKPGGKVDVNIPQDDGDLNAQYDAELAVFAQKPPKEVRTVSPEEKQEDYYKGFRSAVVLVWVFCNFALAAVVLSAAGLENLDKSSDSSSSSSSSSGSSSSSSSGSSNTKRSDTQSDTDTQRATIYMAVVLWSVAGLSVFRFIGALWFLIVRMVSDLYARYMDLFTDCLISSSVVSKHHSLFFLLASFLSVHICAGCELLQYDMAMMGS